MPADLDPALGRLEDAGDQPQQRRLAGAVAPDEPDRLARLDREGDVAQRPDLAGLQLRCAGRSRSLSVAVAPGLTRKRRLTPSTTTAPGLMAERIRRPAGIATRVSARLGHIRGGRAVPAALRSPRGGAVAPGRDRPPTRPRGTAAADTPGRGRSAARASTVAAWTSSSAAPSAAGSVCGQHAVAEVEDVAGPAARALEHRARRASRRAPTARAAPPGRGCPARRGPRRPAPSRRRAARASRARSRRRPPRRSSASRCVAPVREVDRRHVDGARGCAPSRARRTRGSRRPTARRPTSRRAGSTSAPARDLRRQRSAANASASFSMQRVPDLRRAVHQRLRPRRSRAIGRPSTQVAGDRERPAAEADDRLLRRELGAHEPRRPRARPATASSGLGDAQRARRRPAAATGRATTGPDPLDELDLDAHAEDREHDVGEHARPRPRRGAATGWSVTSAQSSGCRQISKSVVRSRIARYSGSERPAWRMNHTGVRSTGSRRQARTRSGSGTLLD